MDLHSSCDGVPYKNSKRKIGSHHFTSTDYLSLILAPYSIRRTIPLRKEERERVTEN
jgi:hypothetical protein